MTLTIKIQKTVYGGDGLGRLGDGRVVFVTGAFAGETVKAEIVEEKKHFVRAKLLEILEKSPDRVDGSLIKDIPGIVYADLSFEAECRAKGEQLKDFLARARLWEGEVKEGFRGKELNYRNKVVYHFEKQNGKWALGYREEPSHKVVDIISDPLAAPAINAKLPEIRKSVLALLTSGAISVRKDIERKGNVTIRWSEKSGVKWWIGDAPKDVTLKEVTAGETFEVPAGGFYQVNPEVGDALVKAAVREFNLVKSEAGNVIDLYCGVGVFGLSMNPVKLIGIESGREAIDFAKKNAASQHKSGKFFAEQVGKNLKQIFVGPHTVIVVDPPRGGMEPNVPAWLAQTKAPRIFYVSCDPATLTRDLKTICRGYEVEKVEYFNMFPRTARFETLVVLKKKR